MGKLFGTAGVRGLTNKDLTPEFVSKFARAVGTFFGSGSTILTGRDVRAGGDMVLRALHSGLLSSGVKVFDGGMAPTPAVQYAVRELGYDGGVIVTASHNPAEFNGIKVLSRDGSEIYRDKEEIVEQIFFEGKLFTEDWRGLTNDVKREDRVLDTYVRGVLNKVDIERVRSRNFRVLIDGANSVGSLTSPIIARELGCKVYTLNCNIDPTFPAREPEPGFDTLVETAAAAKAIGVDLAVAHDGDADRAIFMDSKGRIQWGDRSGTLLSKWVVRKHPESPKRVVTAVSSSILVEEFLRPEGIEVEWTKVGIINIAHAIRSHGAAAGFEENGGFLYPKHQFDKDGGMTFALMLEALANEKISSADLFDSLPQYYTIKTKVPARGEPNDIYERVKRSYSYRGRLIDIDGVKVVGNDYWFLVRRSGTEPVVRIQVEAKSKEQAETLAKELMGVVK
ncbi:phosphoglucosamine mutase [Sulfodiicoccus acidiphilus]|uniref:Phosphoglucosamine mutase n=1 Tax=Sulfodiicoccus acidiphilus TaxID=1670455 RepID=A0A348B2U7_9CREN|nr:phosphoglucosamine mutase [Sulfodiicoccus acidiphilus]BBD72499.1 phosphoglucosamine mutase [Sulfodiicoccus acidiphilus]GGT94100.1 phosphoglucosamine mutase [Sulfodiicoccus acidiphilus]